jgi:anaerobic selenocysteine-containing dehydrogenase
MYPLGLTTGSRRHQFFISNNRQITTLRSQAPFPNVTMNPKTGAKYGIQDGDWVWIETPRGKITQKAKFLSEMDPRIINCEMGWWYPEAGGATMADTDCVGCGQCTTVCPTQGIRLKRSLDRVGEALDDPNTMVVAQVVTVWRQIPTICASS